MHGQTAEETIMCINNNKKAAGKEEVAGPTVHVTT